MVATLGLDLSHYQSLNFNLGGAQAEGVQFVILKAGEGNTADAAFSARLSQARACGLLIAAYWYQRSGVSAKDQAAAILAAAPSDLPIIMDVETGSGTVSLTLDIVNRLRAAGRRVPLLYIPQWYWQSLGSPSLAGLPPLWSSRYPDNVVRNLVEALAKVPASYWQGYGGLPVSMIQFTSSAIVAGYQPLDANAFNGSRGDLAALFGSGGLPAPASKEIDEMSDKWDLGQNMHEVIPCAGRAQFWYLYPTYGRKVYVHQVDYIMPTDDAQRFTTTHFDDGSLTANGFTGVNDKTWVFESDKPGPVPIPTRNGNPGDPQPVGVSIRYSSDDSFRAYCG